MRKILLILYLFLIVFACQQSTTNDNLPPKKVQWIPKTPDTFLGRERGIDAIGDFPGKIQLEWKASDETDLVRYLLYVSVDNINFINEKTLLLDEANQELNFRYNESDSSFIFLYDIEEVDHGLGDPYDKPFYFYIKAEDEIGQKSEPSDTVHYSLGRAVDGLGLIIDANSDSLLAWSWSSIPTIPNNIIIRIEYNVFASQWEPVLVKLFSGDDPIFRQQFYDTPSVRIQDLRTNYNVFRQKGLYRWRIDVYNSEDWGSESNWATMRIN